MVIMGVMQRDPVTHHVGQLSWLIPDYGSEKSLRCMSEHVTMAQEHERG